MAPRNLMIMARPENVLETEHFQCSGIMAAILSLMAVSQHVAEIFTDMALNVCDGVYAWEPMRGGCESACHHFWEMDFC